MTYQEAIEMIERYAGLFPDARGEATCLDMAVEALEKQIPMKPQKVLLITGDAGHECGCCGELVGDKLFCDYCSVCGQRIDWGE